MAPDPIHGHPPWALMLVAVSVGNDLADGADMLWNQTLGQAWDLLCHHFGGSELPQHRHSLWPLCGLLYGVSAPKAELRLPAPKKLLLLSHQAPSLAFIVASWATLATLALFCLVPLGWMGLWFIQQHHQVLPALVVLGGTGLATMAALSIMLGVHILVSDVL